MAVVLICALDPDERLVRLVRAIAPRPVVVVDDGSGPGSAAALAAVRALGATVLTHPANLGKGAALRTGIGHVRAAHPGSAVVTADCDGQHTPEDVAAVEAALDAHPEAVVLGERALIGDVPLRSRLGNAVSRSLFALASGVRVGDAQTGLRGLPAGALRWIGRVPGDRFEHEQRVLLEAARRRVELHGVPIATVYLDGNASSHFRPIADSARVLAPLLGPVVRFAALGLACFALDALLVVALTAVLGVAGLAALAARAVTAAVHFAVGRRWVFAAASGRTRDQARRYALLALATVVVGALALQAAVTAGAALLPAKLAIDACLAGLAYVAQRFGVFAAASGGPSRAAPAPAAACAIHPNRSIPNPHLELP